MNVDLQVHWEIGLRDIRYRVHSIGESKSGVGEARGV